MKRTLNFIAGGLAPHVIAWVEVVIVIILISFLSKKFHVVTFYFILNAFFFFFYFFLSCQPRLEGAVGEEEPLPLLSCTYHFRIDNVVHLKHPHKSQQIFYLFFLFVPLCSSSSTNLYSPAAASPCPDALYPVLQHYHPEQRPSHATRTPESRISVPQALLHPAPCDILHIDVLLAWAVYPRHPNTMRQISPFFRGEWWGLLLMVWRQKGK